jgi:hypothetical protein
MEPVRAEHRPACLSANDNAGNDDAIMAASNVTARAIAWTLRLHSLSVLTFSRRLSHRPSAALPAL